MTIENEKFKNKNYEEFIEFKGNLKVSKNNLQGSQLDNLLDIKRERNRYLPNFSE